MLPSPLNEIKLPSNTQLAEHGTGGVMSVVNRIQLLIKMAELEERLLAGCSERIQMGSFVSAFQVSKAVFVS